MFIRSVGASLVLSDRGGMGPTVALLVNVTGALSSGEGVFGLVPGFLLINNKLVKLRNIEVASNLQHI